MLVTEKDANSKRCLMLELIQTVNSSAVRGGPGSPVGCIGSNCMWWRWGVSDLKFDDVQTLRKPDGEINPPFSNCPEGYEVDSHDCDGYYQASKNKRIVKLGYCGLAGKPE